jgi:Skp family chaperone for outer membrane proteins
MPLPKSGVRAKFWRKPLVKLPVAVRVSIFVASLALAAVASAAEPDARGPQKLAVVNVSFIFENYLKVPDLQRKIDETHKGEENELQQQFKALAQRNKDLEQFASDQSEATFDKVQQLRKDQFLFERARRRYDEKIQEEYTKGMKDILTDIRVAIRIVADRDKYDLILRSPDADDPTVVEGEKDAPQNPAAGDNKTFLEMNSPQTVAELTERFNRNPVLYGAKPADITKDVLVKLNDEYLKHGKPVAPVVPANQQK